MGEASAAFTRIKEVRTQSHHPLITAVPSPQSHGYCPPRSSPPPTLLTPSPTHLVRLGAESNDAARRPLGPPPPCAFVPLVHNEVAHLVIIKERVLLAAAAATTATSVTATSATTAAAVTVLPAAPALRPVSAAPAPPPAGSPASLGGWCASPHEVIVGQLILKLCVRNIREGSGSGHARQGLTTKDGLLCPTVLPPPPAPWDNHAPSSPPQPRRSPSPPNRSARISAASVACLPSPARLSRLRSSGRRTCEFRGEGLRAGYTGV